MNRLKKSVKNIHTEEGATLVELLAAIAILSIVVMSFLAFFVQAGNTNNRTSQANEATFLAQEEMEQITYLSQNKNTLQQVIIYYSNNGYNVTVADDDTVHISKSNDYSSLIILDESIIESVEESQTELYNVVVTVTKGGQSGAEMETVVPFAK